MTCYGALARVYDRLVQGVDFEGWADYVEEICAHFHVDAVSVVDLACGTGNTALPLAGRGYRVTGVDLSRAMLALAGEKARRLGLDLEFKEADMRLFSLPAPVDLVTCFHDGLNYLSGVADLVQTFTRVRLALKSGGLFIFDLNALEWLAGCEAPAEETVFTAPDYGLTWRTRYDREQRSWEIDLRGWILENGEKSFFAEGHREQAFTPQQVADALAAAGLSMLALYHPFTLEPATPTRVPGYPPEASQGGYPGSRRHFYVAGRA